MIDSSWRNLSGDGDDLVSGTLGWILDPDCPLYQQFAEDLEEEDGGLLEINAQQFGGLFNTIECRETWAGVDQGAR